ncbi:LysR family transcriptional regulator [Sphingomonas azotifigens]|uniref:LysR family transcriptional regulator n=1 Tax=Sphingomonas azotifigens TaxID=330920 RepID=UPI0009FF9EF3|nr:LysR family transcriptional regulator [Sphingomonas azotifigens]
MEWSDIRVFLQVAREGTMVAATSALRMDHSTISRRIARLERETDLQLFERAGRRLTLTAEGERLAAAAEKLESIIFREVLSLASERRRIAGAVRLGTTEEFGAHFLAHRLAAITALHPGLEIELVALPRAFSLAAREVDLVISLDRPSTGDIRFKKLIDVEFGVYGAPAYFANRTRPASLDSLREETWCGFIKELLFTDALDLLPGDLESMKVKYRTTNLTVQLGAALSGYALAALPCFVAREHPMLERVLPQEVRFERSYWIAVHEDLANLPKVRALMSAIESLVARDRTLFRPAPPMSGETYGEPAAA